MTRRHLRFRDISLKLIIEKPYAALLYPHIRRAIPFTQLKYASLVQMYDLVEDINKRFVPGSIVEMGCGGGGNGAFIAKILEQMGVEREVWLFDSFEGLSEPNEADIIGAEKERDKIQKGYLAVDEGTVEEALRALGVRHRNRIHVIKGWFDQTVPDEKQQIGDIAILRLDADLYEPTRFCLDELYDRISPGGYVVVDDYRNWIGSRRALYEFFYTRGIAPYIDIYPYGGVAYFQKKDGK